MRNQLGPAWTQTHHTPGQKISLCYAHPQKPPLHAHYYIRKCDILYLCQDIIVKNPQMFCDETGCEIDRD